MFSYNFLSAQCAYYVEYGIARYHNACTLYIALISALCVPN